ncbi:hypothetical protein TraAM80_09019 [Trypanosoma rangeli]|uniref:Uncharacterized protein n=1 Tax=Trypanosoma rangeli TaxID=5698 RepID=A0A3R7N0I8_TRYRA|nr:uncharacterized protein TraAM80_09019 [Trypanosoma rangeli]RNE98015.1 hypothetical protein TraAM80_09019 [Trypanosoma rangeli]|eukprot:RNE98015.1 hypothetical protein TraAM80_09019 [Trypanosoma rangeli]
MQPVGLPFCFNYFAFEGPLPFCLAAWVQHRNCFNHFNCFGFDCFRWAAFLSPFLFLDWAAPEGRECVCLLVGPLAAARPHCSVGAPRFGFTSRGLCIFMFVGAFGRNGRVVHCGLQRMVSVLCIIFFLLYCFAYAQESLRVGREKIVFFEGQRKMPAASPPFHRHSHAMEKTGVRSRLLLCWVRGAW